MFTYLYTADFSSWPLIFEILFQAETIALDRAHSQASRKVSLAPATSSATSAPPWLELAREGMTNLAVLCVSENNLLSAQVRILILNIANSGSLKTAVA